MKKYEISTPTSTFIIEAPNKFIAAKLAKAKGVRITSIQELNLPSTAWRKRLKSSNLTLIFKELSLLVNAGISLQQAVSELYQNDTNKNNKLFFQRLVNSLKSGQNLSQAFENSGFAFDKSELALIKMGENTGDLAFVFARLGALREKRLNNAKKLKKALSYPTFVFATLVFAFFALMFFVVPQFQIVFDEFELNLPLITRLMLGIYAFLAKFYPLIIVLIAFFAVFYLVWRAKFRLLADKFIIKTPVFGRLIFYHQSGHFFLVFSLLLKSGISVSKALHLAKSSFSNAFLAKQCEQIAEFLAQGLSLDEAFKKVGVFENLVIGMLSVAMKSAKLDMMSEKIAEYYETKGDDLTEALLRILEPLMTLFVAILVLFLALAIFLPMWELNQSIKF